MLQEPGGAQPCESGRAVRVSGQWAGGAGGQSGPVGGGWAGRAGGQWAIRASGQSGPAGSGQLVRASRQWTGSARQGRWAAGPTFVVVPHADLPQAAQAVWGGNLEDVQAVALEGSVPIQVPVAAAAICPIQHDAHVSRGPWSTGGQEA